MTTAISQSGKKVNSQQLFGAGVRITKRQTTQVQSPSCFNGEIAVNGRIDSFEQGEKGDCFLLAALVSISNNKKAAEILKNNIKKNPDGSVTVTFPGIKIYNQNNKFGQRVPESYTITKEEFARARNKGKHSTGDDDVLVYELAFAKYRKFIIQHSDEENILNLLIPTSGSYSGGADLRHPLEGGTGSDAIFLLTGYNGKCHIIRNNAGNYFPENPKTRAVSRSGEEEPLLQVEQDEEEAISTEQTDNENQETETDTNIFSPLEQVCGSIYHLFDRHVKGNNLMDIPMDKGDLIEVLNEFNPKNQMITVGVEYPEGYHELSLKSVNAFNVVLINPWNSDEEVHLTRWEFLRKVVTMDVISTYDNLFDDSGITGAIQKTGKAIDKTADYLSEQAGQIKNIFHRPARP